MARDAGLLVPVVCFGARSWRGEAPVSAPAALGRRRIWSETLPLDVLGTKPVLDLVRRYALDLLIAVRPGQAAEVAELLARTRQAGIRTALWPMLADADGRWASARNARSFCDFVERLVDDLGDRGLAPAAIEVDLEPPIALVKTLVSSRGGLRERRAHLAPPGLADGACALVRLGEALRGRGIDVSVAAMPLVLLDPPGAWPESTPHAPAGPSWQTILGTPTDASVWQHVSVMLYTSMIEGWSRGVLGRRDALSLLAAGCAAARTRWGARAGVSLGVVGTGALETEPTYRGPDELARDVAIALAAGVDDLTLFDLGGVVRRAPAERWLEAFVETPPEPPRATPRPAATLGQPGRRAGVPGLTVRARAVLSAAWLARWALDIAGARAGGIRAIREGTSW